MLGEVLSFTFGSTVAILTAYPDVFLLRGELGAHNVENRSLYVGEEEISYTARLTTQCFHGR